MNDGSAETAPVSDAAVEGDAESAVGGGADAAPKESCGERVERYSEAVSDAVAGLADCSSDADCVEVDPSLECDDGKSAFSECPRAVAAARRADFLNTVESWRADYCDGAFPDGCRSGVLCVPGESKCVAGTCAYK
jgi:hypothetical protein